MLQGMRARQKIRKAEEIVMYKFTETEKPIKFDDI